MIESTVSVAVISDLSDNHTSEQAMYGWGVGVGRERGGVGISKWFYYTWGSDDSDTLYMWGRYR